MVLHGLIVCGCLSQIRYEAIHGCAHCRRHHRLWLENLWHIEHRVAHRCWICQSCRGLHGWWHCCLTHASHRTYPCRTTSGCTGRAWKSSICNASGIWHRVCCRWQRNHSAGIRGRGCCGCTELWERDGRRKHNCQKTRCMSRLRWRES